MMFAKKKWMDNLTDNNHFDICLTHMGITQWCSQVVNIGEWANN